ncbi:hypothetical protein OCU04_000431 [Sclerotinia nivalis]|uniref:Uncharacterized protein n=1 Tax=Sclerotinia nivalis TaxID=352851 RepID=A0A9X0AWR2_9HELO|nr:hypothetical protein OCU04_000431 [Sclerotinia nivalis]
MRGEVSLAGNSRLTSLCPSLTWVIHITKYNGKENTVVKLGKKHLASPGENHERKKSEEPHSMRRCVDNIPCDPALGIGPIPERTNVEPIMRGIPSVAWLWLVRFTL